MKQSLNFKMLLLAVIVLLTSCNTVFKIITGVKNPEPYSTIQEREDYYQKFLVQKDVQTTVKIFEKDQDLVDAYNAMTEFSFPIIILKSIDSSHSYSISCFDDVDYDVESVNNQNLEKLTKPEQDLITFIEKIEHQTIKDVSNNLGTAITDSKFDCIIVTGIFMGKKINKKMLPLLEIKGLRSLEIIDLSIRKNLSNILPSF